MAPICYVLSVSLSLSLSLSLLSLDVLKTERVEWEFILSAELVRALQGGNGLASHDIYN
jgi:hypothetical protein